MRVEEGTDSSKLPMHQNKAAVIRFFLGGLSGAFAKTLVAPLDRVKIIFQISRKPFSFAAVAAELRRTVEVDGWRGLFRGNTAQVLRVLPYSGSQLACFDVFSGLILAHRGGGAASPPGAPGSTPGSRSAASQLGPLDRMAAGAAAGAVSVVLTYPLDLLRARLAVAQELPGGPKGTVKGLFSTLRTMLERDSFFSLYRGLSPTLLGILPYAGISFAVYEALKQWSRETRGTREPLMVERLLFGGIAGFAGQASAYPLDIVRRECSLEEGGGVVYISACRLIHARAFTLPTHPHHTHTRTPHSPSFFTRARRANADGGLYTLPCPLAPT